MTILKGLASKLGLGGQTWMETPQGGAAPPSPDMARILRPVGPATQDVIQLVDAQDDMLFLNNGMVVAGVQVFSVSEALMTEQDMAMRISGYRDALLKHARFPFQWLIGTRPQVLDEHVQVIGARMVELASMQIRLQAFASKLHEYLAYETGHGQALFANHFGHAVSDFVGLPGEANTIARALCDAERIATLRSTDKLDDFLDWCAKGIEATVERLDAWSARLRARTDHLVGYTAAYGSPVRTLYVIVSHNPRTLPAAGALTEREISDTKRVLEDRCGQIVNGLTSVRVRTTRATHTELLREIQYFFHPATVAFASPPADARQSLAREMLVGE